jgi:hypothetical protein
MRHTAEHEFAQARVAVAAHHHEIGAAVGGVRQERVGDVDATARNTVDIDFQTVPGEVLADIGAFDLVLLAALIGDDDDFDAAGFHQQRQGIADGARRLAAAVPA